MVTNEASPCPKIKWGSAPGLWYSLRQFGFFSELVAILQHFMHDFLGGSIQVPFLGIGWVSEITTGLKRESAFLRLMTDPFGKDLFASPRSTPLSHRGCRAVPQGTIQFTEGIFSSLYSSSTPIQ